MDTIISALISAGVTLLVCVINSNKQVSLIEYKIDQLTERVNKHNNVVERTYELEQQMKVTEERVKVINHRLGDLEHDN